ncbi:hypothetical protein CP533_5949 [Ophiocordyceps camponoti-saundersi (nom. inval.)]|nr:hypothetical protein CP533_5949 [Ophiocordyceps camponoti-saundersi (nom. inval.)]
MAGNSGKRMRLPPLKVLRVHSPKKEVENPCIAIMSSVLACWASVGFTSDACATIETQLRTCMDRPPPPPAATNSINYHLSRMKKFLISPGRRK